MNVDQMIQLNPATPPFDAEALGRAITSCFAAAGAASACADACLSEPDVADMQMCIRLDLLCADTAAATGRALARLGSPREGLVALVGACAEICQLCAVECAHHDAEHCALCAQACQECDEACTALLSA